MTSYRARPGFFEIPHAAVYTVMTATILASGFCFVQSGTSAATSDLLFRYGGMYSGALARHEYWRLLAYGFLHGNFIHLTLNMLCLVLWGGHLERRIGPAYFLVVYFCSMVFGAIIGNAIHSTPYLTVGASGATSGMLGALLCLWVLGKLDLRFDFFAINIGLNIAFAVSNSRIDWGAHLGGFAAGLIACALLDLIEKVNAHLLRCKFPEFVKINLVVMACGAALLVWISQPQAAVTGGPDWAATAGFVGICCLVIKLVDLALSMKKGLAITVVALAAANAAMVMIGGWKVASLPSVCTGRLADGSVVVENLLGLFCSTPLLAIGVGALAVAALTFLFCSREFYRGTEDVGFVGASLRAERKRRQGL
jgi:membrane associated rhomboid family serine protease